MKRRRLIVSRREPALRSIEAAYGNLGREVALVDFDWPRSNRSVFGLAAATVLAGEPVTVHLSGTRTVTFGRAGMAKLREHIGDHGGGPEILRVSYGVDR